MKKLLKTFLFGAVITWLLLSFSSAQVISSRNSKNNKVPDYYYANYQFIDDWNAILDWFTDAKARYSTNQKFASFEFVQLAKYFDNTFPYLTKDYSTVYGKCSILAKMLAEEYSYVNMESLMWNACYKSLTQAINKINTSYTVNASVITNPTSWMAPLTVTFDARGSSDPSEETIPEDNFYWYYRDEKWVDRPIWQKQVLSYTFEEAGKFIVHLVVRSSNVDKWILDWEKNITINVTPKAADIVVYANTRKMSKDTPLKIGTMEWERWVVFDGSLTVPRWWRKILSHRWTITNNWDTIYDSKELKGTPSYIQKELKWSWEFKVTLSTKDNENNSVYQTYSLYVSDPVTVIRQTPINGDTSTLYNFDWSASYSITNKLSTYYWEIFDANGWEEHGDPIKVSNDKKTSINFSSLKKRPWNYLVRLTVTDAAAHSNVETNEIYVESTPPTPQFIAVPTKIWTYPSEFTLDASNSMDIDVENWVDSLEYSWSFSSPEDVDILSTENNNEKIVVRFNSVGNHRVTLTATDEYGKSASVSKIMNIESTLRPQIEAIPWAITWWKQMKFKSTVNSTKIYEYAWDFWDSSNNASQFITEADHVYGQKWIYDVELKVTDSEWHRNAVKERVFIWEIDSPIAAYKVTDDKGYYLQPTESCKIESPSWTSEVLAFPVDRYAKFNINPSYSVNTKWNSAGLQYVFSKQAIMWQDKVQKVNQLNESFSEVWCHYVDLQVSDPNVWKEDKTRIWFSVQNALPVVSNVLLSYPQDAANTSMIGFGGVQNDNRVSFECSDTNNLTIKVTAVNAEDPDWTISRLRFYYYNVDDPDRILEFKDTWINAPYAYFLLPRIWWEFKFGVMIYDNDGGMIDSKEYLASNPSVYFPASCSDADVPSVTLRVSPQNAQVWDEVTYTIVSKLSVNNEDFSANRTFYYDFTWDWTWDLVTKKDTVTYQFLNAYENWITPKAAVEYRRKLWIADGATIYVKDGIKPILLYNSIWNTVIFRDLSIWAFQQRELCFEKAECDKWNNKYLKKHRYTGDIESMTWWTNTLIKENDSFLWAYDKYWQHNVQLYLKSKYWIDAQEWLVVKTSDNSSNGRIAPWVNMITIPETTFQKITDPETGKTIDTRAEIFLAKNMNNKILMYINSENEWTCYVDTDIATDSDWDGKTDNDIVFPCNKIVMVKYQPNYENVIWRVYFTIKDESWKESLSFKNFYIGFEWYVLELSDDNLEIYNDITKLIDGMDDSSTENTELKKYLNKLRRNLNNVSEVSALVVDINEQISNGWIRLDSKQADLLDSILSRLSNSDTIEAWLVLVWMNDYEKNKQEILALIPTSDGYVTKNKISEKFAEFEKNNDSSLEDKKNMLNKIWETAVEGYKSNKWENENDLTTYFCNIFSYYDVISEKCVRLTESTTVQENYSNAQSESSSSTKGWFPLWLKIILIILLWWVLMMVWIIVFFSIKARINSSSENEEDEW